MLRFSTMMFDASLR